MTGPRHRMCWCGSPPWARPMARAGRKSPRSPCGRLRKVIILAVPTCLRRWVPYAKPDVGHHRVPPSCGRMGMPADGGSMPHAPPSRGWDATRSSDEHREHALVQTANPFHGSNADDAMDQLRADYDVTPYNSTSFPQSAPGRLAATAHLFGLDTPEVATA